jgi:phenylalanine-4-hydroxylase
MLTMNEPQEGTLRETLPILDLDHPGAKDADYRERRVHIASLARAFRDEPNDPYPIVSYTEPEHEVWRQCFAALLPLQEKHACNAYLEGRRRLALPEGHIPQLADVSGRLASYEGFRLWPVEGLVLPRIFMQHLERRIMLSTQYIRHPSRPFFTPEPDIVHELLGHAPMLSHAPFVALSRLIGRGARWSNDEQLEQIGRLYWFTVEFGLIEEEGETRAFGAGLLGGVEDLTRAFASGADVRPFDLEEIISMDYDYNHPQPIYFVIPSFDELCGTVSDFVASLS